MSQLSKILRDGEDNMLMFECPGCGCIHGIKHGEGPGPRWTWNGDAEKPTFSPSLLVKWDTLSAESRARNEEFHKQHGRWMTSEELPYDQHHVCHSFVRDGRIEFLGDCTHSLAGQTVDIPAWE